MVESSIIRDKSIDAFRLMHTPEAEQYMKSAFDALRSRTSQGVLDIRSIEQGNLIDISPSHPRDSEPILFKAQIYTARMPDSSRVLIFGFDVEMYLERGTNKISYSQVTPVAIYANPASGLSRLFSRESPIARLGFDLESNTVLYIDQGRARPAAQWNNTSVGMSTEAGLDAFVKDAFHHNVHGPDSQRKFYGRELAREIKDTFFSQ